MLPVPIITADNKLRKLGDEVWYWNSNIGKPMIGTIANDPETGVPLTYLRSGGEYKELYLTGLGPKFHRLNMVYSTQEALIAARARR